VHEARAKQEMMPTPSRGLSAAGIKAPRIVPWALLAGVLYVAGMIKAPPWGGLLVLLLALVVIGAVFLLLRRVGLFLAAFVGFAVVAPFLSRIVELPLGWAKGTFFLLALPLWALVKAPSLDQWPWPARVRLPFLGFLVSAAIVVILAIVSFARGIDPILAADTARGLLLYPPLIFIAAEAVGDLRAVKTFLAWILVLCVVAAAGAVAQALVGIDLMSRLGVNLETWGLAYVAIDPVSGKFFQRVFSVLDDQVALASFSLVGLALSLFFLEIGQRAGKRLLCVLAFALCTYSLVLTYNITVMLGTALFVLILVWKRRSPRLLAVFLAVTLTVTGLAWLHFGSLLRNRIVTSFSTDVATSTSMAARIEENRRAISMFAQDPIIGQGLGSTANAGLYYRMGLADEITGGIATDNFYMTAAVEGGVIGLGAVLLLHLLPFWGLLKMGRSRCREYRILARIGGVWVVVLLLLNFSNAPMNTNPTNLLYWCLGGLAWRVSDEGLPE
jgi:O-antigen ligase